MWYVKVNEASLTAKIKLAEEKVEEEVKQKLTDVAEDLVAYSPVDTGAFVTSWSIVPRSSAGGRSRSSRGKPRRQDPTSKRNEALNLMKADMERFDIMETSSIVFRNRAPHARFIDHKYLVRDRAKDRAR